MEDGRRDSTAAQCGENITMFVAYGLLSAAKEGRQRTTAKTQQIQYINQTYLIRNEYHGTFIS